MLVLGDITARQNETGWFTSGEVAELIEDFRLPSPQASHISSRASDLIAADFLIGRGATRSREWALTPTGRRKAVELVGAIDTASIEAQLTQVPGAELGDGRHPTLPATLAPPEWSAGIAKLLDTYPFETNVLCMTRFPRDDKLDDPNEKVIETVETALAAHGLKLHLASNRIVEATLWANVAAYMWACQYGIALFEDRVKERLNYNLTIEVGAMLMAGRPTGLLRDEPTVPKMPSDLVGHIYKPVDFGDLKTVRDAAHLWAADDLALGRCKDCPK